jgi:hypothetical protein
MAAVAYLCVATYHHCWINNFRIFEQAISESVDSLAAAGNPEPPAGDGAPLRDASWRRIKQEAPRKNWRG